MRAVQPLELRRVAGRFATGVTVVTTVHQDTLCGITVNSFTTVSLVPPLVLISISKKARAHACLEGSGRFAVNVLREGQEELARRFASLSEDKFARVRYRLSPAGQPLLGGVHAWLDCEVVSRRGGGRTHTLYTASVTAVGAGRGGPLIFHRRGYASLAR